LQTFQDRPDEVKVSNLLECTPNSFRFECKVPSGNGFPISQFNVYLKEWGEYDLYKSLTASDIFFGPNKTFSFEVDGLQSDSVYSVMITACNSVGEGYKPTSGGQYVKTMREAMKKPCQAYVWGDNTWSQLGLPQDALDANKFVRKTDDGLKVCVVPTLNKSFGSMVYDVAPGNAATLFTVTD
jgi:hypothetical protein